MKTFILSHKILSIFAALILLIAIGAVSGGNKKPIDSTPSTTKSASALPINKSANTDASQKTQNQSNSQYTSSTAIKTTPSKPTPKVLLDITGNGSKQTQKFTTSSNWNIKYTFDCTNFGSQGNFQYFIYNGDGSPNTDTGANDLAVSGGTTNYYYDNGEHYLSVNSECDWHVVVTDGQ